MFVQTTTTRTKVNSGCEIVPVGGYSNRDWCKVHESYSDYATGWCNRVMSNPTTTTHTYVQSRDRSELKFTPCAVCGRARRVGPHSGYRRATVGELTWDQETLDRNGGHTPECEQYCDPSCPIGQEKRAEANRRAHLAQLAWNR